MKYFTNDQSYPRNIAFDPLPWNMFYEYVSSTFLNGFINYVDIVKAYLLDRYTEKDDKWKVKIKDPPSSYNWIDFEGNKEEIFNKLTEPGRVVNSHLADFRDDVIILSKIPFNKSEITWEQQYQLELNPISENRYMFFWFDRDCSDCCIGRFYTDDKEEKVIKEFDDYVLKHQKIKKPDGVVEEIPLHYFKGWISG